MKPLTQQLDRDYIIDVVKYKVEFARVDVRNNESLRRWFKEHHYLTASDHARIAEVAVSTIYTWRARVDMPRRSRPMARPPLQRKPDPVAPPDWRSTTWLEDSYRGTNGPSCSLPQLMRATGLAYITVYRMLKRRGVELRSIRESVKSRHPCCNRAWLVRHYAVLDMSIKRCAALAGVSRITMACWLADHKLRLRQNSEQEILGRDSVAKTTDGRANHQGV